MAMFGLLLKGISSRAALTLALVGSMCFSATAVPTQTCDSYCFAKRLLAVFYPELHDRNAIVKVSGESSFDVDGPMVVFQLSVLVPIPGKPGVATFGPPEMASHITALFKVSMEPGGILEMQSAGEDLNEEKVKRLTDIVASHPEWSDARVIEEIDASGARFGPRQKPALLDSLPVKQLESLLGEIRVDAVTFNIRAKGDQFLPLLDWTVDLTATKSGVEDRYYLFVEPFDGRVSAITRVRRSPKR